MTERPLDRTLDGAREQLARLVRIMARLRAPDGCPWDREQDHRTLQPYLVEEAYEVLETLERLDGSEARAHALCDELGDLLFQIVFHAELGRERGTFDLGDVAKAISDKLEYRHPHVFGDAKVKGSDAVADQWVLLKAREKAAKAGKRVSVIDGVPKGAPALLRAERTTEKASRIGFDWPDLAGVRAKLDEELRELDEAIASGDRGAIRHELGDVLFSVANLARKLETPAEDALRDTIGRFEARFHFLEARLEAQGIEAGTRVELAALDALWDEAKAAEKAALRAAVGEL